MICLFVNLIYIIMQATVLNNDAS